MSKITLEAQAEREIRSKVAANQYHKEALKILIEQGWCPPGIKFTSEELELISGFLGGYLDGIYNKKLKMATLLKSIISKCKGDQGET